MQYLKFSSKQTLHVSKWKLIDRLISYWMKQELKSRLFLRSREHVPFVFRLFIWSEWLTWEILASDIQHSGQKILENHIKPRIHNKETTDDFKAHHKTLNMTLQYMTTQLLHIAISGFYLLWLLTWTEKNESGNLADNYYYTVMVKTILQWLAPFRPRGSWV